MNRGWMSQGVCAAAGAAWLDMETGFQLADCARCPVQLQCLRYAVDTRSTGVVMGGVAIGVSPIKRATVEPAA